jgi:hypothetical protein
MTRRIVFLGEALRHEPHMDAQALARPGAVDVHLKRVEVRESVGVLADNQRRVVWRGHFEAAPDVTAIAARLPCTY